MKIPRHPGISEDELLAFSADPLDSEEMSELYNHWIEFLGPSNFVWGAGNPKTARLLIVGEAPGFTEDYCGTPFTGTAGVVLSSVLKAAGISRKDDCYIINTVLKTPWLLPAKEKIDKPSNDDLKVERARIFDVAKALPELRAVALLGGYAYAQYRGINPMKVKMYEIEGFYDDNLFGVPLGVAYHPAYLAYQSGDLSERAVGTRINYLKFFKHLKEIILE